MTGKWSAKDLAAARKMCEAGMSYGQIAAELGRSRDSVRDRLRAKNNHAQAKKSEPENKSQFVEAADGTATLSLQTNKPIRTLEDLMRVGEVDRNIWRVKKWTLNKWEMGYYDPKSETAKTKPLFQVKAELERIAAKWLTDAEPLLFRSLRNAPLPKTVKRKSPERALELALFDTHLGKYAWGDETGTNQDTDLQARIFANAVGDLLNAAGDGYEQIVIPIGNDFFQANNWLNETEAGTRVDHDGRMARVFDVGVSAVFAAIMACRQVAPVKAIWVPGNHDPATSFYLCKALENRFWGDRHVSIDCSPPPRKYWRYGVTLLGLTHGNEEKFHDLPAIMAQECRQDWAETTWREWHVGHFHTKKRFRTQDADESTGIRMCVLPSISGTDAWHFKKGYVHAKRAAEAYVWGKRDGYLGHWSVNAREA